MSKYLAVYVASIMVLFAGTAHAVLPVVATDALTALGTDIDAYLVLIWPVLIAVTIGFVLMKLFKKGANKAT